MRFSLAMTMAGAAAVLGAAVGPLGCYGGDVDGGGGEDWGSDQEALIANPILRDPLDPDEAWVDPGLVGDGSGDPLETGGCRKDRQCPAGQQCDRPNRTCVGGCTGDASCEPGSHCDGHRCVLDPPDTTSSGGGCGAQCQPGYVCLNLMCQPMCKLIGDCPE